jgi:hypothetical protein
MRSLLIIVGGFILWGACIAVARVAGQSTPASLTLATVAFIALWLLAAGLNMWAGVARAGYSFREELPIFLLIFLVPVAVAAVARWKFL